MSEKSDPPYLVLPGMPMARNYGESAKPWPTILQGYDEMVAANVAFSPISELAHALAASPFWS
ncbi:MAG: hypothetical protein ABIQ16_21240 [Polyangiaceae bacterium]